MTASLNTTTSGSKISVEQINSFLGAEVTGLNLAGGIGDADVAALEDGARRA